MEGKRLEREFCLGQAKQAWTREWGVGRQDTVTPGGCTREAALLRKNVVSEAGGSRQLTLVTSYYLHTIEPSDPGRGNEQDSSVSPKQLSDRAFPSAFGPC